MLDLYQVFLMDDDILFPVLYPAIESANPILAVSLINGKVKEVPHSKQSSDLTLDLMADCSDDFDLVIRAAEKLRSNTITITGLARSGKDTLCDVLLDEFTTYRKVALGDALRLVRKVVYGESNQKDRHELIQIGQGLRKDDERIWIKAWVRTAINLLVAGAQGIIVTDVRQPNEFEYFKQFATTVYVAVNEEKRLHTLATVDGEQALDSRLLLNETEKFISSLAKECEYCLVNNYDDEFRNTARWLAADLKGLPYA